MVLLLTPAELSSSPLPGNPAVKTVSYRKAGVAGGAGRVSLRTFREMIARWEIGPDDLVRLDDDPVERKVREYPGVSPLDDMLAGAQLKLSGLRQGEGRRLEILRELELLREYAEHNDRIQAVVCFLLGWLRYAENPAVARGLFLKAIERGYPATAVARNNLAVTQIRLGDPAGRDNLILAANDPQRPPAALRNLARLLHHLQGLGEDTESIASIKDLLRVARVEWHKAPPGPDDPAGYALFLCEGDIPASFTSEARLLAQAQGQIEDLLSEAEDFLRQGRLEQTLAHAARIAAEIERAHAELARLEGKTSDGADPRSAVSPLRFLLVRLERIEKAAMVAKNVRDRSQALETYRRRLREIEESLRLPVPPADLIPRAEILVDSARTDAEREEAQAILRGCHGRIARHLITTSDEMLASGEREVAESLLRRAQTLDTALADEITLRLASLRREELEKEILEGIRSGAFEEARMKIARLRSVHRIFEPFAKRLEREADTAESNALLDRVTTLGSDRAGDRSAVEEALALFQSASVLHPEPAALAPLQAHLEALARRHGLRRPELSSQPRSPRRTKAPPAREGGEASGFELDPAGD